MRHLRQLFVRPDGSTPCTNVHGDHVSAFFFAQSSFAEYALATERNVVKVADDVPIELMGPLGCGIQTGAGTVMNALAPEPSSSIAVFGAGSVGFAAIMGARVAGCATIVAAAPLLRLSGIGTSRSRPAVRKPAAQAH